MTADKFWTVLGEKPTFFQFSHNSEIKMVQDILLANNFNFRTNSVAIRATSSPLMLGQSFYFRVLRVKNIPECLTNTKKKKTNEN